ncbi:MAG: hypothetical protein ABSF26_08040 [Thermoguttaceae bacterium]|jgi:hypothetical protein
MKTKDDEYLRVKQAAAMMGIAPNTMRKWGRTGKIPEYRHPANTYRLVEGDNLVALKALLPYYAGQVKCIYIDPPYNTGNEGWVYNDNVIVGIYCDQPAKILEVETQDDPRLVRQAGPAMISPQTGAKVVGGYTGLAEKWTRSRTLGVLRSVVGPGSLSI